MAEKTVYAQSGGIGFAGALFLVFLTLKLTGVITWSWWWITVPLWGGFLFAVVVMALIAIAVLITVAVSKATK